MEGNDTSFPNHRLLHGILSGKWITSKRGEDAIMAYGRDIFLLVEIIQHLHVIGRCTLNLIDNLANISPWS